MSQSAWDRHYANLKNPSWADRPSIFVQAALPHFPAEGRILELGAGCGQDTRFFAEKGYEVVSTDGSEPAVELNVRMIPDGLRSRITCQRMDMGLDFPFDSGSFDAVYAHLSIHYFSWETTERMVGEILRVLKGGGVFAFIANSTRDPDYGTGPRIEDDFFMIGTATKRYFCVESVRKLVASFEILLLDNLGESYGKAEHGVHNLIRFVGRKPQQRRAGGSIGLP